MAMALANELASLNIVVEKWDSSKIGGTRAATQAALLQTLTAALSKSMAADKDGKR
jgi:hypothetical protein